VDNFAGWTSSQFLEHFIPDSSWAGCAEEIGAFDCQGNRHIELKPMPDYEDNDGYGWEGPLIVKQHYPLK
jgi:hypothetical protein